ncbi:MAG: translation elongation factor 4 [Candidatus Nealsonbacteria bacterium]|nr:translation elongation factor 4 [Candidatus Nealsonbacteria bacterium]
MEIINQNQIRNFVICAHIDHGKSTLADRFLELTKTIAKEKMRPQYLDAMDLEQERGITIKMHPVRMSYTLDAIRYTLNLIDTPGHVDFSYEVSRALAGVEGAILLVDAIKGIQAQTLANLELARKENLIIIPVINKIDLIEAKVQETKQELAKLLNISPDEIFEISAKFGTNVENLLKAIIEKFTPPKGEPEKPFRALIFDSKYDSFKGVIAYVKVVDGKIGLDEKIHLIQSKAEGKIKEIGYFTPELSPQKELKAGEIGYIATGIKEPRKVRVGETITKRTGVIKAEPLPGYQEPKPMVFASIYPENPNDFELLKEAISKLKLNDASLVFEPEIKEFLGRGFRCGFLGSLHAEIFSERIGREFGLNLVISFPSVAYKIINKKNEEFLIKTASDWPSESEIKEIQQPWVKLEIITPVIYLGEVLSQERRLLIYEAPLKEIIVGFYDKLKNQTKGFASLNYEFLEYRRGNLVKLEILIAGKKEEPFSKIIFKEDGYFEGKKLVEKLKEILPGQLFSVPIQALISGRIIARETIRAKGKDVIAPLYGGDYTRKKKLLEKQKKGKKELKEKGRIEIPSKVFLEIFKQD